MPLDQLQPDAAPEAPQTAQPDGNDPAAVIGWFPDALPQKVKAFLEAAKAMVVSDAGAALIDGVMGRASDMAAGVTMIVGKTVEKLQDKMGPLTDEEHDKVAFFITGWIVSSLQLKGAPGLDTPEGRQDLIGRVLQKLDASQGAPGGAAPMQGAPAPQEGPMVPRGTMPQLGGGP